MEQKKQKHTKKQISCGSTYDRLPPHSQWAKYPWFVAQMQENQIFYTLHNPQLLYRCQIPELIGTQIRASFHGWVVLSKHPTWFLWNPLTSNLIRLPPLIHLKHEPDQCCLSSPPDDPTSVFIVSTHGYPILTFCRLDCTRNKLKWAKFPYGKELRTIIGKNGYLHDLTCCNGKVYAFNSDEDNHTVIEIDIAVEEKKVVMRLLSFVEHPGFSFTRFCKTNGIIGIGRYLKGYCSELFYIEIDLEDETSDTVGDVHLYKLDMSNMIWEKMEDLKDAIFFLQVDSEYPVYYTPVITTELAGYIHILDRMGKLLYSYHVKNRTISIASMSSLVPTSDMSSWGMLEYRLGGDNDNLKQEEDKDDGNIVVKSATISKPPVFDSKKRTRTDESYLLNLPFHILESILEHCVCVEYMNFRATCKLCHLAAPSIQWSNKTTLKRLQSYSEA
ncbi:cation/H+ exchanger, CPA1 family protein [Tanacetum coccineum]